MDLAMNWQQSLSLIGAACILGAYAMQHLQAGQPKRKLYASLNIIGSAILLWVALEDMQYGFIVLQAAWLLISLFSMKTALRKLTD